MSKEATATTNELYYSDTIEDVISVGLVLEHGTAEHILEHVGDFRDAIYDKLLSWEQDGVKNIFASLLTSDATICCQIKGTKLWSKEKIEAFEKDLAEKREQDDTGALELLKGLISQYPDDAVKILAGVLKSK